MASKDEAIGHSIQPHESDDLSSEGDAPVNASDAKILRRIDVRLMPAIVTLYLLAFLDRINISNAITLGLQKQLHLEGNEINTALAIFYVPYIVFEIPSNFLLKRFRPHVWLSSCMVLFGLIMLCHGFGMPFLSRLMSSALTACTVESYSGLIAARFFLGFAEAGVLPGCSYLLSMWYQPHEALRRYAIFLNSVTLAGAFGSLLATAINLMDGVRGYAGWQWIFILEGVLTIFVGSATFFLLPDFPETTKWLSPAERRYIQDRAPNTNVGDPAEISWAQASRTYFADYKSYVAALLYLGANIVGYSASYFLPTIVKGFHYSNIETQLHTVPPFAAAWGFSVLLCFIAARSRHHLSFIVFSWALCIAGTAMLLRIHHSVHAEYAAVFLVVMGLFGGLPIAIIWYVMSLRGHGQRALGTAWMIGFGNIGGIIATFSFQDSDAPHYHKGYSLIMFGIVLSTACAIVFGIGRYWEARKAKGGRASVWDVL